MEEELREKLKRDDKLIKVPLDESEASLEKFKQLIDNQKPFSLRKLRESLTGLEGLKQVKGLLKKHVGFIRTYIKCRSCKFITKKCKITEDAKLYCATCFEHAKKKDYELTKKQQEAIFNKNDALDSQQIFEEYFEDTVFTKEKFKVFLEENFRKKKRKAESILAKLKELKKIRCSKCKESLKEFKIDNFEGEIVCPRLCKQNLKTWNDYWKYYFDKNKELTV